MYTQTRNLIYINASTSTVAIANNNFSNNGVVRGVIYVDNNELTAPVLIADNSFSYNSAFFSTMAIYIRARTTSSTYITSIIPAVESDV